jgi:spermidine synthase
MSQAAISPRLGAALVFFTSAEVLVIEILAGRLLAPYAGVTLETFTAIIGTILAGISLGAFVGGRIADQSDPQKWIPVALIVGGALAMATIPVVRVLGPSLAGGVLGLVILVAMAALPAAAVLSAVTPMVVKLLLADLTQTGHVVGRVSAIGTAGAIVGTFVTGFVLVANLRTSVIVLAVGIITVVWGVVVWIQLRGPAGLAAPLAAVALAGLATVAVGERCDIETAYFCARVEVDAQDPNGRVLWLDTVMHSHVDLSDPTHLAFRSTRMLASAIESETDGPIHVVHVGGGGLTLPRWVEAARPGSTGLVLELDPGLIQLARDELGYVDDPNVEIRTGDARTALDDLEPGSAEVVVGDAFGGLAVPWHLTTIEVLEQVETILTPDGIYAMNLIDHGQMAFARAEMATLGEVFDHVAAVTPTGGFETGGNLILIASNDPIDLAGVVDAAAALDLEIEGIVGERLVRYIAGAQPLTDEFAPVDQLLDSPGSPPA